MFNVNHSFISRYGHRKSSRGTYYTDDNGSNDRFQNPYRIQKDEDNEFNKLNNLNKGQKRNQTLSKMTIRKIRNRVWYLNLIAEEKEKLTKQNLTINYKLSFLTLTISGTDWGGVLDANKKLLNTLLTELRRNCNMRNYVWRLERQKNGKIHYHIITDAAINYKYLRHVWNRIQIEAGYMESFTQKFSHMNFIEYRNHMRNLNNPKITDEKIRYWFAKGNREKWQNPNSVDVRMVWDDKQINYYISKYISKDTDECENTDNADFNLSGRVWGSSNELAKCHDIAPHIQDLAEFAYWGAIEHTSAVEVEEQYCSYVLIDWKLLFAYFPWLKRELKARLEKFADLKPSTPLGVGFLKFE